MPLPSFFPYLAPDQKAAFYAQFGPPSMGRIATLQNQAPKLPASMLRDEYDESEATSAGVAPIIDTSLPDTELVKRQMGAAPALFNPALVKQTPTGFDYSAVKPIRGGSEELLNNPKFATLLRTDPRRAAQAYQSITGRDLGNDFQERRKLDMARTKDISDTLRSQIIKGEMRQNPDTGFVERRVSVPDPKNPLQKIDAWETMDSEAQLAHSANWETAIGAKMARPNPLATLQMSPAAKAMVMAKYISKVRSGQASPQQALEEAIKETPSGVTDHTAPSSTAAATPQTAQANSANPNFIGPNTPAGWVPPAGEAYQSWATNQAMAEGAAAKQAVASGVRSVAEPIFNNTAAPLFNFIQGNSEGNRLVENAATGIGNFPNRVSTFFGGKPLYPWLRPTTPEDLAKRKALQSTPTPPGFNDWPWAAKAKWWDEHQMIHANTEEGLSWPNVPL